MNFSYEVAREDSDLSLSSSSEVSYGMADPLTSSISRIIYLPHTSENGNVRTLECSDLQLELNILNFAKENDCDG